MQKNKLKKFQQFNEKPQQKCDDANLFQPISCNNIILASILPFGATCALVILVLEFFKKRGLVKFWDPHIWMQ